MNSVCAGGAGTGGAADRTIPNTHTITYENVFFVFCFALLRLNRIRTMQHR